jgi:hypothetical protein
MLPDARRPVAGHDRAAVSDFVWATRSEPENKSRSPADQDPIVVRRNSAHELRPYPGVPSNKPLA